MSSRRQFLRAALGGVLLASMPVATQAASSYDFVNSQRKWNESSINTMLNGEMKQKALEAAGDFLGRGYGAGFNIESCMPEEFYSHNLAPLEKARINTIPLANTAEMNTFNRNEILIPQVRTSFYDVDAQTAHIMPYAPGDKEKKVTYRELWYNNVLRKAVTHTAIKKWGGSHADFTKRYEEILSESFGADMLQIEGPKFEKPSEILQPATAGGRVPTTQAAQIVGAFFRGLEYVVASDIAVLNHEEHLLYESKYANEMRSTANQIPGFGDPVNDTIFMAGLIRSLSNRYPGAKKDAINQRYQHVVEEFLNYMMSDNVETHVIGDAFLRYKYPSQMK